MPRQGGLSNARVVLSGPDLPWPLGDILPLLSSVFQDVLNPAFFELDEDRTRWLRKLTGLQFRQAQLDLANAERQAVVAGFDTKVAEVQLLRTSGGLLPAVGVRAE